MRGYSNTAGRIRTRRTDASLSGDAGAGVPGNNARDQSNGNQLSSPRGNKWAGVSATRAADAGAIGTPSVETGAILGKGESMTDFAEPVNLPWRPPL